MQGGGFRDCAEPPLHTLAERAKLEPTGEQLWQKIFRLMWSVTLTRLR